jgi:glycosyltransferase involved in cell wall biosynthesis
LAFKEGIDLINKSNDVIHITSQTMKPIFNNPNSVITIHDAIAFDKKIYNFTNGIQKIKKFLMKHYLKEYLTYNNIITVSNHVKNQLTTKLNVKDENISVIPPYISDNFFHLEKENSLLNELGLPLNKKLILSISSNDPRKNLPMVDRVMKNLDDSYQLVRIGSQIGNSITFNNVDDITINKIYNACDVLLFPTLEEGFGYPVVEAFKTGLPVISSDIDIIREVANEAALLVNPEEIKENVEGIFKILDNSEHYIKKGYERAKYYSGDVIKKKLTSYYNSLK